LPFMVFPKFPVFHGEISTKNHPKTLGFWQVSFQGFQLLSLFPGDLFRRLGASKRLATVVALVKGMPKKMGWLSGFYQGIIIPCMDMIGYVWSLWSNLGIMIRAFWRSENRDHTGTGRDFRDDNP
jgi:hypothetical protein